MGSAVTAKPEHKKGKSSKSAAPAAPVQDGPRLKQIGGAGAGMPLFLGGIQTKLVVNQPGDPFERQADRVADAAVAPKSAPRPFLKMAAPLLPPAGGSPIPASDSGAPLSPSIRQRIEPSLGTDLSQVRVHSAPADREVARGLGAHAFTHGRHIWLGPSQSAADVKLMAHEATHVVQQGAAPSKAPPIQRREAGPAQTPEEVRAVHGDNPALQDMVKDLSPAARAKAKDKPKAPPDPATVARKRAEVLEAGKPAAAKATRHLPQLSSNAHAAKAEAHKPPSSAPSAKGGAQAAAKAGAAKAKAGAKAKGGKAGAKGKGKKGHATRALSSRIGKPAAPPKVRPPRIARPLDAAGKPLAVDAAGDAGIMGLAMMAQAMRLKGHSLREQAAQESQNAHVIQGNMAKIEEGIAKAEHGIGKSEEHVAYRREVLGQAEGALHVSQQKAETVAAGAPKYQSTSAQGKAKSGPMSSEAKSLASENDSKKPDDKDAAEKSRQQGEKLGKVGADIGSMDDAMTQTKAKADTLAGDAAQAKQKNAKVQGDIAGNHATLDKTQARLTGLATQNTAAQAQLGAQAAGPTQMAAGAASLDQQGEAAIQASIEMEQRAHAAQEKYLAGMRSVPAVKRKQPAAAAGPPVLVQRQPDPAAPAAAPGPDKKDERINLNLGAKAVDALPSWLTGEEKQSEEDRAKAQAAEQKRRAGEIKEINDKAGGDFSKLTAGDKAGMALSLMGRHLFGSVAGIKWPNFIGSMLQGLVDPRMALMGVVSGLSMVLSGIGNLGTLLTAEGWSKDPLGNLLKSAAEIATGITIILGSITALAMAIIAILVAAAILTFGALSGLAMMVIPFCMTVVSTLGPMTVEAAGIALALNVLVMIKDLIDAATADTAEKLQTQSDALTEDAKTAGNMAMQIAMAKVGEVGGKYLAGSKFGQAFSAHLDSIGIDLRPMAPRGGAAAPEAAPMEPAAAPAAESAPAPKGEAPPAEAPAPKGEAPRAAAPAAKPAEGTGAEPKPGEAKPGETKPGEAAEPKTPTGDERVAAERSAPDGHKVKATKDGGCEVCSPGPCPSVQKTVETQLDTSEVKPDTKARLKAEADAAARTPDPEARADAAARVLEETKAAVKDAQPAPPGEKPAAEVEKPAAEAEKPGDKPDKKPGEVEKPGEKPGEPEKPAEPEKAKTQEDSPEVEEDPAEKEGETPEARKGRKNAKQEIKDRLEKLGKERAEQQAKIDEAAAKSREVARKLNEKFEKFDKLRNQKPPAPADVLDQARQEWREAQAKMKEANLEKEALAETQKEIVDKENAQKAALDEGAAREKYMGATPGKASPQGLKVQAEMRRLGTLDTDPVTRQTIFKASDGEWYPLEDADMAHKVDAVDWWNKEGRFYGAKSPQVRRFMLDWENYVLDRFSLNRSAGARLGKTYLPPAK